MSSPRHLLVVWDPASGADVDTALRLAHGEMEETGWELSFVPGPVSEVFHLVKDLEPSAVVIAPSGSDEMGASIGVPCVRFELVAGPVDRTAEFVYQVSGLGLDGLPWALRAAMNACQSPTAQRVRYGTDEAQFIDVRGPESPPFACALLLHGGFYRSYWQSFLMDALAIDLARRGWRSFNVEFRRPDRHGWLATQEDLRLAMSHLKDHLVGPFVIVGHSVGGQLALQMGEWCDPTPDLCVSLTGVVDLVAAHDRGMGDGAVAAAMGSPVTNADWYSDASPIAFANRKVEWLLIETEEDSWDLREMNMRLAASTSLLSPELLITPGDHFSVIDPQSEAWTTTLSREGQIVGLIS